MEGNCRGLLEEFACRDCVKSRRTSYSLSPVRDLNSGLPEMKQRLISAVETALLNNSRSIPHSIFYTAGDRRNFLDGWFSSLVSKWAARRYGLKFSSPSLLLPSAKG
jgi:hypothetical protein